LLEIRSYTVVLRRSINVNLTHPALPPPSTTTMPELKAGDSFPEGITFSYAL
jgi:hypothetical protein